MNTDYQKLMQEQDWKRITLELLYYCMKLFKQDGKDQSQIIAQGHLVEDIATNAIELVISGQRRWNPERGALIPFLKLSVVRNLRSNIYKLKENSILESLEAHYASQEDGSLIPQKVPENLRSPSVEEIAINNEDVSFLIKEFQNAVNDMSSEEAQGIFDCLTEGIIKPRDIETLTGVSSKRISEVKRQIKNKLRGSNYESK